MVDLNKLDSKAVWKNFQHICSFPHPSKHEEKLVASLVAWAKERKIDVRQDETGNIIMTKPALSQYIDRKSVV